MDSINPEEVRVKDVKSGKFSMHMLDDLAPYSLCVEPCKDGITWIKNLLKKFGVNCAKNARLFQARHNMAYGFCAIV